MRIRKQPRQLPACRENFLPCMVQEISREGGKICGVNFVAKTLEASSSPSQVADQMKTSDPSNYLQEPDDDNPTRHYVRRGQRNGGASIVDAFAAIPKVKEAEFRVVHDDLMLVVAANSYELCDRFPDYSEKKVNNSCNVRHCNMIPRSAILCDSDVDDEADHPSREPEGSLLHSLYLQLLAAGREGISLRGLFASFESQTSLPRLDSNWREQVKTHLKSGPYFEEVKGRYLLCEFLVQPQSSKRTSSSKRKDRLSESLQGAQTRRKASQTTVHKAVPSESVPLDFQFKLQRQKMHDAPMESIRWDLQDMTQATQFTKSGISSSPIRVTKPVWNSDEQVTGNNIRFGGAIPGSLKAMQARIIAETGVQVGVRCARKDGSHDSSKWQCPMMAMEGHTLCEHHSFLNERKRARYAKARRQGDSRITTAAKSQSKPVVAMKQQQDHMLSPGGPRSELHNSDSDDLAGLDEVASQALLTMKSDILAVENLHGPDKPLQYVPDFQPFRVDRSITEEATKAKSHHLAGPQFFARSPTGRFIAAKKTAVKIPVLNSLDTETSLGKFLSVPCTRPPSIPPLPAFYGPRRKTVKNRSLLSIS